MNSMTRMILKAPRRRCRRASTCCPYPGELVRFALLQVMSQSNDTTAMALLGNGTVMSPTEAIAFCRDDMVKLPTSLTLEQAVRRWTRWCTADS